MDHHHRDQPDDREHRQSHPGKSLAGVLGPITLDGAQKSGDKHNRGQVYELEHENRQGQDDDVGPVEEREF